MRVRGAAALCCSFGGDAVLVPYTGIPLGLDVLGMTEVLKVPGPLFVAKELCCLKLGSVGLGRQWRRAVQLRSPYRVLRREYCLSGIPLRLMRSNSWVLTCS